MTQLFGGEKWWDDIEQAVERFTCKFILVITKTSFAQFRLATFYQAGRIVKKGLLISYLLLKNIISKSADLSQFEGVYCCEYIPYQFARKIVLVEMLEAIEIELGSLQHQGAIQLLPIWIPQDDLL